MIDFISNTIVTWMKLCTMERFALNKLTQKLVVFVFLFPKLTIVLFISPHLQITAISFSYGTLMTILNQTTISF